MIDINHTTGPEANDEEAARMPLCARLRRHQAWLMRYDEGLSLSEIGRRLKLSRERIYQELAKVDDALSEEARTIRERIRATHHFRLEAVAGDLMRRLLDKGTKNKEAAGLAQALNRVLTSQRKMWGVDAPARVIVSEEDVDAEIVRELDRLARGRQAVLAGEIAASSNHSGHGESGGNGHRNN